MADLLFLLASDFAHTIISFDVLASKCPIPMRAQSITVVLDEMRARFRECDAYFTDALDDANAYLPENVLGVPTERERSVLQQNLPVYRALLTRK